MKREDKEGKLNHLSYTDSKVMRRYGEHMKKGEKKHGRSNWKKGGYPKEEYLESIQRHLYNLVEGRTNEDHAASIMFNIIGYMYEESIDSTE